LSVLPARPARGPASLSEKASTEVFGEVWVDVRGIECEGAVREVDCEQRRAVDDLQQVGLAGVEDEFGLEACVRGRYFIGAAP